MQSFLELDVNLESKLFRLLGTFWQSIFSEPEQVRTLMDSNVRTAALGMVRALVHDLAGQKQLGNLVTYQDVHFQPSNVFEAGQQLYDDPDKQFNYGIGQDAETVFDHYRCKYWVLPVTSVLPLQIQSNVGPLILGIDFFIHKASWIYFRQDVSKLFPRNYYHVTAGFTKNQDSMINRFIGVNGNGNEDLIVDYLKRYQTPKYFNLALAAVAKLGIVRTGGVLLQKTQSDFGVVTYVFETESVRVDYPHTHLIVGKTYPELFIIGDLVRVYRGSSQTNAWWRQINWRGGLSADPFLPEWKGLPIKDTMVPAYVAGQDSGSVNGSRVHSRLKLSDDYSLERDYWNVVSRRETETGYYLNAFLDLAEEVSGTWAQLEAEVQDSNSILLGAGHVPEYPPVGSLPNTKLVNALDTLFQAILGHTAMIVVFEQNYLKYEQDVFQFLAKEFPIGCTPIIIGFVSNVPVETVRINDDFLILEDAVVQQIEPEVISDEFSFSVYVQERVIVRQEIPLL